MGLSAGEYMYPWDVRVASTTTPPPPPTAVSLVGDWGLLRRLVTLVYGWEAVVAAVPLERQMHLQSVGGYYISNALNYLHVLPRTRHVRSSSQAAWDALRLQV